MKIPQWVYDEFNSIDTNRDGKISQKEIDSLKGSGSIFDPAISYYKISADMDILLFIKENRKDYGAVVQYTDNEYTEGRKIMENGKMVPTDKNRSFCTDNFDSVQIEQGEFAVKTYSKDTPSLQTYHVCQCVAVTVYDRATKRGFLAHIDSVNRADSLEEVIKNCKFNPKTSEVRIIGGWDGYSEGKVEIIDEIIKRANLKVVEYDVLGKNPQRAVQLDLKTGEVFNYIETTPKNKIRFADKFDNSRDILIPNEQSE